MLISGIGPMLAWQRARTKIEIQSIDLRCVKGTHTWLYGRWGRPEVERDPLGYQWVDLGGLSHFRDIDPAKLRIAIGSCKNMYRHHSNLDSHKFSTCSERRLTAVRGRRRA